MYVASKWNWSFSDDGTHDYGDNACGYSRCRLVGRESGAVHTELGLVRLEPGGRLDRHVHSFEQCAYVMGGEPVVEVGTQSYRLRKGDYVMFPVAMPHSWHNPGSGEARWMEFSTPQELARQWPPGYIFSAALRARPGGRPQLHQPDREVRGSLSRVAAAVRGTGGARLGPRPPAGRHGHRTPGL